MKRLLGSMAIVLMIVALFTGLSAFTSENDTSVNHEISLEEFESNVQNLAVFRADDQMIFEQNSEEFALEQIRDLVNDSEATRFKINYGAHFDGTVVAMPTTYNKNGEPIAFLQKGLPCPPICGTESKRVAHGRMAGRTY